jgi:hypothetical protein
LEEIDGFHADDRRCRGEGGCLCTHTRVRLELIRQHHPTILISPSSDYLSSTGDPTPVSDTAGYIVAISTHTHTPLPPVKYPKAADGSQETMRPGVTGKDLRLAMALEEVYQSLG